MVRDELWPRNQKGTTRAYLKEEACLSLIQESICVHHRQIRVNTGIYHRGTLFVGVTWKNKLQDEHKHRVYHVQCLRCREMRLPASNTWKSQTSISSYFIEPGTSHLQAAPFIGKWVVHFWWDLTHGLHNQFISHKSSFLRDLRLFGLFWYFLAYK